MIFHSLSWPIFERKLTLQKTTWVRGLGRRFEASGFRFQVQVPWFGNHRLWFQAWRQLGVLVSSSGFVVRIMEKDPETANLRANNNCAAGG